MGLKNCQSHPHQPPWMSSNTYVSGKGDEVRPGGADGEVVVELLLEHGPTLLQTTLSYSMKTLGPNVEKTSDGSGGSP